MPPLLESPAASPKLAQLVLQVSQHWLRRQGCSPPVLRRRLRLELLNCPSCAGSTALHLIFGRWEHMLFIDMSAPRSGATEVLGSAGISSFEWTAAVSAVGANASSTAAPAAASAGWSTTRKPSSFAGTSVTGPVCSPSSTYAIAHKANERAGALATAAPSECGGSPPASGTAMDSAVGS